MVDLAEIADLLGVTAERAAQLVQRHDFPEMVGATSAGSLWKRDEVLAWSQDNPSP